MGSGHAVTSVSAPEGLLVQHPLLGRAVRGGDWSEQGVATSRLIRAAIDDGDGERVAALTRHFLVEAEVCHRLYRQWIPDLRAFLAANGVDDQEVRATEQAVSALAVLPDGRAWDPDAGWDEVGRLVAGLVADPTGTDASGRLDGLVEAWRRSHDRDVDHVSGLMDLVVRRLGEAAIGPMYDGLLRPWFEARYSQFDVSLHPWADALTLNMLVAFEAMRGHLCGPGRRGDVGFTETDDRYVLTFDPCGSGGRSTRGDEIEGTPPRTAPPYGWAATTEPAPWNHGRPGVCVYCTHCVVLTEIMPVDSFGYPVRAVDPPRPADAYGPARDVCSWTMFKDPGAVPDEYYTRIGRTRPAVIGSAGGS